MDHLYDRLRQPFTVEIIETDGTRRTGTIDLEEQVELAPPAPPPVPPRRMMPSLIDPAWYPPDETEEPRHELPLVPAPSQRGGAETEPGVPVHLNGYEPGEEVCIAFVVAGAMADASGEVSFQVPRHMLKSLPSGEVAVLGRSSCMGIVVEPLLGR